MNKERIILVGSGQHARVVLYNLEEQGKYDVACFVDNDDSKIGKRIEGYFVAGNYDSLDAIKKEFGTNKFFIAFGDMRYRRQTYERFVREGFEAVNIIHPNAIVSANARLGKGVLVECGCLLTPNPVVGDNVVVNTGSQINHDNVVHSHVYIASGVILSGGVKIRENTLIDDGVIITLGTDVPPNSIIGAGAVMTKSYEKPGVYYGNPARFIREIV